MWKFIPPPPKDDLKVSMFYTFSYISSILGEVKIGTLREF